MKTTLNRQKNFPAEVGGIFFAPKKFSRREFLQAAGIFSPKIFLSRAL